MARVISPPSPLVLADDERSLFLAGSIEMGGAPPWQDQVVVALRAVPGAVLNPRRTDWDASWRQTIEAPRFRGQVEWELEAQERATAIAMYFEPTTRAPITLLELGLFARSGKLAVCCPPGFWRKGNVDVVCGRYGVPLHQDLEALVRWAAAQLAR